MTLPRLVMDQVLSTTTETILSTMKRQSNMKIQHNIDLADLV